MIEKIYSSVCGQVAGKCMIKVKHEGDIYYFICGNISNLDTSTFLIEADVICVEDWWRGLILMDDDKACFRLNLSDHDDPLISCHTTDIQLSNICNIIEQFSAMIIEEKQVIQGDMYQMLTHIREGI